MSRDEESGGDQSLGSSILFEKINQYANHSKYFYQELSVDLFGKWSVIVNKGRYHGQSRSVTRVFPSAEAAWADFLLLAKKRTARGYWVKKVDVSQSHMRDLQSILRFETYKPRKETSAVYHMATVLWNTVATNNEYYSLAPHLERLMSDLDPSRQKLFEEFEDGLPAELLDLFDAEEDDQTFRDTRRQFVRLISEMMLADDPWAKSAVMTALHTPARIESDKVVDLTAHIGRTTRHSYTDIEEFLADVDGIDHIIGSLADASITTVAQLVRLSASELQKQHGASERQVRRIEKALAGSCLRLPPRPISA